MPSCNDSMDYHHLHMHLCCDNGWYRKRSNNKSNLEQKVYGVPKAEQFCYYLVATVDNGATINFLNSLVLWPIRCFDQLQKLKSTSNLISRENFVE